MSIPKRTQVPGSRLEGSPRWSAFAGHSTAQLGEAAEGLGWGLYIRKGIFHGKGSSRDLT